MGMRTTVILNNDFAHQWEKDPELGKKISYAMNFVTHKRPVDLGNYGYVVECAHADTETLGVIHNFNLSALTSVLWRSKDFTPEESNLTLLKAAAEMLGYRLVKKTPLKSLETA